MARPVGRFPSRQRVRKQREYQQIQGWARRVSTTRHLLLLYARDDSDGARLGTIASRKVGGAVARNRAKRLIREAFRATRALWPPDVDLVVLVRRDPGCDKVDDLIGEWLAASASIEARIEEARGDRWGRKSRGSGLAQSG